MHDAQNPRELALLVLDEIYERGAYANLALNKALRGNGLSSLDRKLCTELVYGTVKTTGTLDWYLCRVINLSLIHISEPTRLRRSRMPSSA